MAPDEAADAGGRTAGVEIYVYWKIDGSRAADVEVAVLAAQAGLCRTIAGVRAHLLRRPAVESGMRTYMEIYRLAGAGHEPTFATPAGASAAAGRPRLGESDRRLIDRAMDAVLQPFGGPIRHVEVFEAVGTGAWSGEAASGQPG